MIKFAYRVISELSEKSLEKALNAAGEQGWEMSKFSIIYTEDKGTLFVAVMKARYEAEAPIAA